jgi:hypothetical protein
MPNSLVPVRRLMAQAFLQIAQLAHRTAYFEVFVIQHGNACRVVTAIFQALQPVDHDIGGVTRTNVSYNSTHVYTSEISNE